MRITYGIQGFKIDGIYIENKIIENQLYEYEIRDREDLIDNLIDQIREDTKNKNILKQDLKLLINMNDENILSSISTNDYIDSTSKDHNLHCNNILKLNKKLGKQ